MRIIDGFDGIYGVYSENGSFDMNKWRSYADSLCFGLSEKCEKDCRESYDFDKQVLPVLNKAYLDKEKLDRTEFDLLQQQVIELLSVKGNAEYRGQVLQRSWYEYRR